MALVYTTMPLFADADYSYPITLEGVAYSFRTYYNERSSLWFWELRLEDGTPVVLGEALVPNYPIALDYALSPLTGYFWLENISENNTEKYKTNPFLLSEYYRLFYIHDDGN